jgi:hypothetical protein
MPAFLAFSGVGVSSLFQKSLFGAIGDQVTINSSEYFEVMNPHIRSTWVTDPMSGRCIGLWSLIPEADCAVSACRHCSRFFLDGCLLDHFNAELSFICEDSLMDVKVEPVNWM